MLMIGVLFVVAPGSAVAEQDGDYTYTIADGKATITGYTGAGGAIIIPSTLGGYPTDAIANSAFASSAGHLVTEATIPRYLTTFGIGVFEGCSLLTAIHVDASNTNFTSINGALYNFNGTNLIECPPGISGNFSVADGTITVEYRAFVTCSALTSITIPDSVTTIGQDAFVLCGSLNTINIGTGVGSIGPGWLAYCGSITAFNVAEGNTNYSSIDGVLYNEGATNLIQYPYSKSGNFTVPSTVTTISNGALTYCSRLYTVFISESVSSIGVEVFLGSTALTAITVDPNNLHYMSLDGVLYTKDMSVLVACPGARTGDFTVPEGVTHIEVNAFQKCVYLTSINVSDSVQTVGGGAFMGCSISSISFGTNFSSIGSYAFYYAGSLTAIHFRSMTAPTFVGDWWIAWSHPALTGYALPESNFPLPGEYFYGLLMGGYYYNGTDFLYSLSEGNATITAYLGTETAVVIPDTIDGYRVVGLSTSAFRFNEDIVSVVIPDNVTRLDDYTFYNCANLTTVNMPVSLVNIGSNVFQGTKLTGDLVIPDSVTYIGSRAFYCCNLTSLVMGSNVETIGDEAFFNNYDMRGDLVIPSTTVSIGIAAFYQCNLTSLVMGPNVNEIGYNSFLNNHYMQGNLVIPENVTEIYPNTFVGCNLTSLVIGPNVHTIGWNAFANNFYLTGDLVISDRVTYIGPGAFSNCDFTSLVMGPNVGTIGHNAFENNHRMMGDLVIPNNVTDIWPNTFNGCNLTSLVIGPNVKTIEWNSFVNNYYLTGALVIPDSVTYIGPGAFQNCNFTSLVIGSNTTIIEANLFENNRYLAGTVVIPDSVTSIGPNAFHGCSRISSIVVGTGLQTIDHNAFDACTSLTDIYFNGLLAPTSVHVSWLYNTDPSILGHAYAASNFPAPGEYFNGLLMGAVIPVAPDAPTGLQAIPGNGNVTLSWFAPADGGAPIDHYLVYQNGILVDTCFTNISVITGLVNGQSYTFNVSAVNAVGEGPRSGSVSSIPRTTPDAPSWLMAVVGDGSTSLNWTAPAWNGGAEIDYYVVYQDGVDVGHIAGLSTVITGLVNGQSYEFYVSAHNAAGAGVGSSVVTAVPYTVPNAPTGLLAVASNGMVTLNWTAPAFDGGRAIDHYVVYQDGVDVGHIAGLSTVITGLVNGQSYEFSVSAHNMAGEGILSTLVSAVPFTYSDAPTGLNGVAGFGNVTLSWTAPAFDGGRPVDYYVVYQNGTIITQVTDTFATITGLVNGVEYQFTVSAHNLAGTGPISAAAYAIPYTVADAPTGLTAIDGDASVVLNWTAPAFDGGRDISFYVIYQDGVDVMHVNDTSVTISALQNGRTYEFIVCASNLAGIGPASSAVLSIPFTMPDPVTGLTAIAGNGSVTLNWTAPSFDGGRAIDYYTVFIDGSSVVQVTGTSVTIDGLQNGREYSAYITAHNPAGAKGANEFVYFVPYTTPDAPTELTAVDGNGNVTLNWTAPAFDGGRAIDYYVVYQDGVDVTHVTGTSSVIEGLVNGQSYEFFVSAHNLAGQGTPSATVSAFPFTVSDAPTGLTAVPSDSNVTLNWTAPAFDGGRAIDHYIVYQDGVDVRHVAALNTIITDLENGRSYEFSVSAYNLAGEGLSSSIITAIPYTYPDQPTGLNAIAGSANATLSWSAPTFDGGRPVDYYVVYQNGTIITQVTETFVIITGLVNGVEYQFTVSSHNLAGTGPVSEAVYAIPYTVPDSPTGLTAIDGDASVLLNWTAPAFNGGRAISFYVIYQDGVDVMHVNGTSATISGLLNGQTYLFTVSASNLAGIGPSSSSVQSIPFTVPNPVTGLTAKPGNGNVTLNWTAPSFDGGRPIDYYMVFVDGSSVGQVTSTSMTIEGLQNGREYSAYVIAHNLAGSIGPDEFVNFIPYTTPDAPTGLTAVVGNGNVTLNWTAPSFNGGRAVENYIVYQDGVHAGLFTGTTLLIEGLTNGQSYEFYVLARNEAGNGTPSSSVVAVPFTVSDAPTGLTAVPSDANVTLNWTAPAFDGGRTIDYYVVYLDGVDVKHVSTTFIWFEGLNNGETYEFSVSAYNLAGEGAATSVVSSVPYTVPGAPINPTAEAQNALVILRWAAPSFDGGRYIDYYIIYQDGVDIRHVNSTMSMIHGLQNGQAYEFSVSAHNLAGEGSMSTTVQSIPFTVPDAPTGLTNVDGDGNVFLIWTAPSFDGGRAIDYYVVYQDGVDVIHVSGTSATLEGLLNGQIYAFNVSAHNLGGEGPQSGGVFSIPFTVPDVPTGLTAIDGNGNVSLNWTAPAFNGGRLVDHYIVYQDGLDVARVNGTSVVIEGLVNGQTYAFQVSANNLAGVGTISAAITAVPYTAPDAPTGLTATAGDALVSLEWLAPAFDGGRAIDHYIVFQDGVDVAHATSTTWLVEGLSNGQTYEFSVSAFNLAGEGSLSSLISAVPYTTSDAPSGLNALPGNANATLTWVAPAFDGGRAIDYYVVYRDGVDVLHVTGTSALIEGLLNGQSYEFSVSAHNLAGEGPVSTAAAAVPYASPDVPTGLIAIEGDANVGLIWTAPAFDGGRAIDYYVVYQDGVDVRHVTDVSVVIGGLVNGQEYSFTVSAHNMAGNGVPSAPATAIPYTVPDAPTELAAVAGNTNVTLNWTAPAFDGGRAIDFYYVYQDGVFVRQVSVATAFIEGLLNGQSYEFYVLAHNVAGSGSGSTAIAAIPYTVPGAPTGLSAVAGDGNVSLNWTAPSFNGGRAIDHYIVYQDSVDVLHVTGTSVTIIGLVNGQVYEFEVCANNSAGSGPRSAPVSSVPFGVPYAPTGLTALPGDGNVTLNWTAPAFNGGRDVDHYVVYQDGVGIGQVTAASLHVDGLVNGQTYEFTVSASNLAGLGPLSVAAISVPYTVPDAPTGLSAVAGVQNVTLNWTAPSFDGGRDIEHYIVYQDGVDVMHVAGTSVMISGLLRNQSYEFSVSACNLAGTGPNSSSVLSTPYGVADAPAGLVALAGDANVTLSWTAPSFDGGRDIDYYIVYQDGVDVGHVSTTTLVVEGLLNGQSYEFAVSAHNLAGIGAVSSSVSETPYALPGAPIGLSAVAGNANVVLNWASPNFDGGRPIDHYIVYQDGVDVAHVSSLTATVNGLLNGVAYTFWVSAVNIAGEGTISNQVSETPYTVPGVPSGLNIFAGNAQVTMFWAAPADDGGRPIDHYVVLVDGVDVMHVTGTTAVVTGLSNGVSYTFSVQAYNPAGNGEKASGVISIPYTVPDAPTGLAALYGDSQVTLTWLAPVFDGGRPIDHYVIYQDGVDVKHVIGPTAVISGLTNGVRYSFAVSAHNTAGYGSNSSSVSATPSIEPGVPTAFSAVPGNGNVSLSWTAPNEDGGSVIDYYVVYQDGVDVKHVTGTAVLITGLTNGVEYGFSVAAHNTAGMGDATATVFIVPYTAPNAPTGLTAVARDGGAAINWTAPSFNGGRDIDHYVVYQDGVEVEQVTGLNVNVTGLTNGSNYTFQVAAVNVAGAGALSASVTVTPYQFPPSAPLNVETLTGDHAVEVSWEGPTNEGGSVLTGYKVYRQQNGTSAELVGEVDGSSLSFTDLSVVPGVEYSYFVVAVNSLGESERSEVSEPVIAMAYLAIDLFSEVLSGSQGIYVTTSGSVRMVYGDVPLAGLSVRISYKMSDEGTWTVLPSVTSSATGSFILSWFPPTSGTLTVKAEWLGDDSYPAESVTATLAIAPPMPDGGVLSVETNSVVTDLNYNSNGNYMYFKVSGEDGTDGYMKVTISKDMVSDVSKLRIKIDTDFVEFTLSETADSYILFLTYHHSTHEVFAYLDYEEGADEDPFRELLVSLVIVAAVMGILMVALLRRKDQP